MFLFPGSQGASKGGPPSPALSLSSSSTADSCEKVGPPPPSLPPRTLVTTEMEQPENEAEEEKEEKGEEENDSEEEAVSENGSDQTNKDNDSMIVEATQCELQEKEEAGNDTETVGE